VSFDDDQETPVRGVFVHIASVKREGQRGKYGEGKSEGER
jgi:hypothetical protein